MGKRKRTAKACPSRASDTDDDGVGPAPAKRQALSSLSHLAATWTPSSVAGTSSSPAAQPVASTSAVLAVGASIGLPARGPS